MSVRKWFQYAWFLVDDTDGVLGAAYHGDGDYEWYAYSSGGPIIGRGRAASLEHAHESILDAHMTAAIRARREAYARTGHRALAGA